MLDTLSVSIVGTQYILLLYSFFKKINIMLSSRAVSHIIGARTKINKGTLKQ